MKSNRKYYYDWDVLMIECWMCHEVKPSVYFSKSKKWMLWFKNKCKKCASNNYFKNRDKILDKAKDYYKNNRDKKIEYQNNYYYNNSEHVKLQHKEYRERNRDIIINKEKNHYANNSDRIIKKSLEYRRKKTSELWFSRELFHSKSRRFVKENNISPWKCMICWLEWDTYIHHPSYEDFDMRKKVVFVCKKCHHNIHAWNIICPDPIDLTEINTNKNAKTNS